MIRHSKVNLSDEAPRAIGNEELVQWLPFAKPTSVEALPHDLPIKNTKERAYASKKNKTTSLPTRTELKTPKGSLEVQSNECIVVGATEKPSLRSITSTDAVRIETNWDTLAREGQLVGPIMHVHALPAPQLEYSRSSSLVISSPDIEKSKIDSHRRAIESLTPIVVEARAPQNTIYTSPPLSFEIYKKELSSHIYPAATLMSDVPRFGQEKFEVVNLEPIPSPDFETLISKIISHRECPDSIVALIRTFEPVPESITNMLSKRAQKSPESPGRDIDDDTSSIPIVDAEIVSGISITPTETPIIVSVEDLLPVPTKRRTFIQPSRRRTPAVPIVHSTQHSAFGTFSAVLALVKLQRRVRKRYQLQRDKLINDLGL